jgi:hypothetical protein
MYTCKEATELLSQSLDRKLTFGQKLGLKMHLSMCKLCTRHKKQMSFLQKLFSRNTEESANLHKSLSLSDEKKEEIKEDIRQQTHS